MGIAGQRGLAFLSGLRALPGTEVSAYCNIDEAALEQHANQHGIEKRFTSFSAMLEQVDAVIVATPMQLHAAQSIEALALGKHVLSEVTACVTLDECWELLRATERSSGVYAMAENYCYRKESVLIRELVRKGLFGEVYFGEGEYLHEVRNLHHSPVDGSPTWRYYYQVGRRGSTYGTHSLGPVMQWFQAADPSERIASVSCVGTGIHTDPEHPHDDTSLMLCQLASGKLIKVRLDMMSNRPHLPTYYSLQGTQGVYEAARLPGQTSMLWLGESRAGDRREWKPVSDYFEHLPDEWRNPDEAALKAGHGGGDYFVVRDFVRACRGEAPPAVGIHTALEWTAADLCSTLSITNGGTPIRMPQFRDPAERPLLLR